MAIQIERTRSDNHSENILKQFKDSESHIIQHLMNILSIKLKGFLLKYENKKQIHNMNSLINLVSDILIERTYSGIYDCIKKWMPILTDYSCSSIIFYDPIGNELFFMGDYYGSGSVLDIKFPKIFGISGKVLMTNESYLGKKGMLEDGFKSEIDNLTNLASIRNFAFVPLTDYSNRAIGVLQLFNKKNKMTELEKEKLRPFSKMIGMCILNTYEMNKTVNLASDIGIKVNYIHNQISNANIFPIIGREYINYMPPTNIS